VGNKPDDDQVVAQIPDVGGGSSLEWVGCADYGQGLVGKALPRKEGQGIKEVYKSLVLSGAAYEKN
jgi:hypothetical protein